MIKYHMKKKLALWILQVLTVMYLNGLVYSNNM